MRFNPVVHCVILYYINNIPENNRIQADNTEVNMGNQKTILTPKDLSEITGKSLRLIYRELRKNNIPHVKCGDISETGVAFS